MPGANDLGCSFLGRARPRTSGGRKVLVESRGKLLTLCGVERAGPLEKLAQATAPPKRDAANVFVDQGQFGADETECTSHRNMGGRIPQAGRDGNYLSVDAVNERRLVAA